MASQYHLDPEFEACVSKNGVEEFIGSPPLPFGDIEARRRRLKELSSRRTKAAVLPDDIVLIDRYASSEDGYQVLLRWYCPRNQNETANRKTDGFADDSNSTGTSVVIFVHGGGLISSSINDYDTLVASLVSLTSIPFLAVEYRLAPGHKYPAALNDTYAALKWLHTNATKLNVDPRRVAIMGSSAGAGLSAATVILARSRGDDVKIAKQILIAPMIDCRNTTLTNLSLSPFLTWNHTDNATGWTAYLGSELLTGDVKVPDTASPSQLASAYDMPELYLEVGGLDIYLKEDVGYAMKHVEAGVPVELHVLPGVPHSYDSYAGQSEVSRMAREWRLRAIMSIRRV